MQTTIHPKQSQDPEMQKRSDAYRKAFFEAADVVNRLDEIIDAQNARIVEIEKGRLAERRLLGGASRALRTSHPELARAIETALAAGSSC